MIKYQTFREVNACRISEININDSGMVCLVFCCGKDVTYGPQFMTIHNPSPGDYVILGDETTKTEVLSPDDFAASYESSEAGAFPELPVIEADVDDHEIHDGIAADLETMVITPDDVGDLGDLIDLDLLNEAEFSENDEDEIDIDNYED